MNLADAVRSRRSTKSYDPDRPVDDATLRKLFELVLESPSSFNLQNWRFVVVRDQERRNQLMEAACGQRHVGSAPVDIIVCGKLAAHEDARRANSHAPEPVLAKLVPMIEGIYENNPQLQRDEAIRTGSLASMTLMLVAESMGLRTCPMIGFDPVKVARIVGLDDAHVPVMLITLGYPGEGGVFPTSRFPMAEVVTLERLDGEGLEA
jgi:nitroreductase